MIRTAISVALLFALAGPTLRAELTVEQRELDFRVLASLYAKRYAPMSWKRQLLNFDGLNIAPWIARIRAAKSDIEYLEISKEYVANFDDLHTNYNAPGSLVADSGLFTDIYGGKVYIDAINRTQLPVARYPIQVGDEVLSIDGKPVEELMAEFIKIRKRGNSSTTRRSAADQLTFRAVSQWPRTQLLGDTLDIEVRQADGELRSYTLPWVKRGVATPKLGPVPMPAAAAQTAEGDTPQERHDQMIRLWNQNARWAAPDDDPLAMRFAEVAKSRDEIEGWVLGWGARNPTFTLPTGFQQRLGRSGADFHFSGVYMSEGKRIGYLRVPNFAPPPNAIAELSGEIAFFRQNTDGLVVDVQRNTGGGCYMLTLASFLTPRPVWFFGEEIRPTLDRLAGAQNNIEVLERLGAEQWVLDLAKDALSQMWTAYRENRGVTGPIPACSFSFESSPAMDQMGRVIAYEKPLIVLIDEFSTSAGDIFPAMMQDNRRGKLVGKRTNGAGGSISAWPAGFFTEAISTNTNSLVVRREARAIPGYPVNAYVENTGAHPDIELERMTVENLRDGGRTFAAAFTRIIVEEINSGQP